MEGKENAKSNPEDAMITYREILDDSMSRDAMRYLCFYKKKSWGCFLKYV